MKILISTLLLTIVIFQNFGELNAEETEAPSLKRKRGRPFGQKTRRQDGFIHGTFRVKPYYRNPVIVKDESDGFLEHMGHKIEVWLDGSKTRILKATYPGNRCPSGRDYVNKKFLVRLTTLSGTLKVVEYVRQDKTLVGVRAPRPTTANVMEPDTTQWFIVYSGTYFRVRLHRVTKVVKSITLASENENEVVQGVRAEEVDMAGFKFVLIRRPPEFKISGAAYLETEPLERPASPRIS